MGKRGFSHFALMERFVPRPIPEGGAEAMGGDFPALPSQQHRHCHATERAAWALAREEVGRTITLWPERGNALQEGCRCAGERNAVIPPRLHTRSWDAPDLRVQVDLSPGGAKHLSGSSGGQDAEFQRTGGQGLPRAQLGHEGRHISVGQGGMVATLELRALGEEGVEVAAPPSRVLAGAQPSRLRRIKHSLDAATHPRSHVSKMRATRAGT